MGLRGRRWLIALGVLVGLGVVGALLWKPISRRFLGINLDTGAAAQTGIQVPAGFTAGVFAAGLAGPRFMAVGPDGTVFVAERGRNRVVALPDADHDGQADEVVPFAGDMTAPSSLDFYQGQLLVGEEDKITLLTLGPDHRATARKVLISNLPMDGLHTTKTVLAGPDGRLYVAMGSICNVCNEGDPRRAAVSVYAMDGSGGRIFSKGLRNAVGLAINPVTHEIWATNNGRDLWGDTRPPETLYVLQDGADYGWPRCHAGTLVDPDFGGTAGCNGVIAPVATMDAHMAPLGLAFYQGTAFPPGYRDSVYIAFHGSWNSTNLVGYKVMRVPLRDGKVAGPAEDFATGWLQDSGSTGRPAGIVEAADGALLVSDDKGGFIYRISATGAR
ncbi:MAG TPA: PQQ-dependent sugar dehydrogenase [Chloroflexia bacterium]|nr:PQQ-dependent sugar dehydrogenase [Chloroflexia bacterium]